MSRHVSGTFDSAPFDLPRLLRESSLQHVEYHESLPSTSTTAVELLEPLLAKSPAMVLTAEQTSGRGRKGNLWWSSRGALTFTLVLNAGELPVAAERRPLISLAAGLAVRDSLHLHCPDQEFSLKWPNDVLTGTLKICGILVEQHLVEREPAVLIGIGVNVNNSLRDAPADILQRATSLFDQRGHSFDLTAVLISILQRLDSRIAQLKLQPRLALSDANRVHLLTGRVISLQLPDELITGTCVGIDEDGCLVIQTESRLIRCPSGIVTSW